ncbi:MAG: signal recognition particle receptor subunit alpha [Proteobacteria bacterium]|nr:signal recognition particle receptor subunit alpha [Pseudomonadota bacterium]
MFENLGNRLNDVFSRLTRKGVLGEADVDEALRQVRVALLEADVALPVVKEFIDAVRDKAVGDAVIRSVTPGQMVVKIVAQELTELLGGEGQELNLAASPPAVILMVGLQGSGKTTTAAKIAVRLTGRSNKTVLMASLDTARPAAQEQLAILGRQAGIPTLPVVAGQGAADIARRALASARLEGYDIVIMDMYMPVMGGIETVKIYRFMKTGRDRIPIIMLTANATTDAIKQSKQAGVDAFLTKPVETKKLLDTIYSLIDKNNPHAGQATANKFNLKLVASISPEQQPAIDLLTLNNLASLSQDVDFMSDLIRGFLKDTKDLIQAIEQSLQAGKFVDIQDNAHAIRGSAKSIGAVSLAEIASIIYKLTTSTHENSLISPIEELNAEYIRTQADLLSYLEQLDKAAL